MDRTERTKSEQSIYLDNIQRASIPVIKNVFPIILISFNLFQQTKES